MSWNSDDKTTKIVLSEGDLKVDISSGYGEGAVRSRHGLSSGKWYIEVAFSSLSGDGQFVGFCTQSSSLGIYPGYSSDGWSFNLLNRYYGPGVCKIYHNAVSTDYGNRVVGQSSTVGMALDLDNKKVWWSLGGEWVNSGDPTDPISGGYAFDFTGNTDTLYLVLRGIRSAAGVTQAFGLFTADNQNYSAPSGYSPIADGWPLEFLLLEGSSSLNGQYLTDSGGLLPVYRSPIGGDCQLVGGAIRATGMVWDSDLIRFDPQTTGTALIVRDSPSLLVRGPLAAYCHPSQSVIGASGYFNQLLAGGKWYLSFRNLAMDYHHTDPYDAVRCGLIRGTENLSGMLGDSATDDVYMVSFGAYNSPMKLHRAGKVSDLLTTVINYSDTEGIALDLTDPTDGRMWVHNDNVWSAGDPVTRSGGVQVIGAWYFAVSVKSKYQINLGQSDTYRPAGFSSLPASTKFITDNLHGSSSIIVGGTGDFTTVDVRLSTLIGGHLLRSFVWQKRSFYYLGLLVSLDPLVEVSAPGYTRLLISVNDAAWDDNFVNLSRFTELPFTATVVGWAIFWYHTPRPTGDQVIHFGAFPSPIICNVGQPGIAFPAGSFQWSVD